MTSFPLPLVLRALAPEEVASAESSRQLYQLREEFRFISAEFGEISIPVGFVTDFASIPRPAFFYLDPEDPVILFGSVVHDYIYTRKGDLGLGTKFTFTRQDADNILREAMLLCGARRTQAWVVYQAVRLGGGSHWK